MNKGLLLSIKTIHLFSGRDPAAWTHPFGTMCYYASRVTRSPYQTQRQRGKAFKCIVDIFFLPVSVFHFSMGLWVAEERGWFLRDWSAKASLGNSNPPTLHLPTREGLEWIPSPNNSLQTCPRDSKSTTTHQLGSQKNEMVFLLQSKLNAAV